MRVAVFLTATAREQSRLLPQGERAYIAAIYTYIYIYRCTLIHVFDKQHNNFVYSQYARINDDPLCKSRIHCSECSEVAVFAFMATGIPVTHLAVGGSPPARGCIQANESVSNTHRSS